MKTTVDVLIATLCYGGNGGNATILPEIAFWLLDLQRKLDKDSRIGRVAIKKYGDIPLTFERNRIARDAIEGGFDITIALDSDNQPDIDVGRKPWAKPFWDSSFEFAFERLLRGVPTVVCSGYCGPPPHENVYVFDFENEATGRRDPVLKLEAYSRSRAAQMRGIVPIGAGPTGVILITTSAYELLQFDRRPIEQILADHKQGLIDTAACVRAIRSQSYFYYEPTDSWETHKASTEDVVFTRNVAMAGQLKHGEPVVFCNFDSWSAHWKPIAVQSPTVMPIEAVAAIFQEAVVRNVKADESIAEVDFTRGEKLTGIWIDEQFTPEQFDAVARASIAAGRQQYVAEVSAENVQDRLDDAIDRKIERLVNPEIKPRMICGRKATSVGHVTPDKDLDALTAMAKNVGKLVAQTEHAERPLRMLEVGSWVGESAIALLGGAPKDSRIYCVDHWEGSPSDWTCHIAKEVNVWDWFLKNTEDLIGVSIFPVKGDSVQAAADLGESQELDLIFLDADHDEASVRADIDAWERHLSPTGVLCGHDYCGEFPGVVNALEAFLGPLGLTPSRIHGTTVWFVTKTQIDKARASRTGPAVAGNDPALASNQA